MTEIHIKKLTADEIQELNVHAAQRILAENSNTLADLGSQLYDASAELGKARVRCEQLKLYKDIITEQNRALKSVMQGG